MKILILANNDLGLYKFRKELIEELIHRDNEVYLSLPYGELIKPFENMGCTFIETPIDRRGINAKTDFILLRIYWKMMKEINPDLVITYTIKPNIYGGIAARFLNRHYAENITGLGTAFEKTGLVKTLVVNLYKIALKKAQVVFFENGSNRDTLLSLACCRKEQAIVLDGAGVNTEMYTYQPYPNNERVKFLFIGRVMKEKGVDELFEATKRLTNEGLKCSLDVVGPFEEDYKEKLEQYENEGWLKYHGYQEDVKPFIADCDCFVLPSYHEGMANTNLECASSGRPVITSNIPGCRESVINGVSGFLCEPKKTDTLYMTMKKMINTSPEIRAHMGRNGRKHMEDAFDKKKVVAATIDVLMK